MTTGRGQSSLGGLLEGVLADLDLRTRFREHLALLSWPQVAGRVVSTHTQAEAVRDGVLIVATDTAAWAQELQMRQKELVNLLAAQVGPGIIREIHFRSGRRRGKRTPAERLRPREIKLSGRQERQIEEAARKIGEEGLERKAERAFAALARMAEWRRKTGWRRCRRCGQWQRVGKRWCSSCSRSGRGKRRR